MIRKPIDSDTVECLKLIYMSSPNMFSYFLIKRPPEILKVLSIFYSKSDVLFSSNNVLVKVENDNVCGLLLSAPGKEIQLLEKNMGKYGKELIKTIGIVDMLKMISRMKIQSFMSNLHDEDEYYISNLAVDERFRGKGIGVELLEKAKEIAELNGYKKLSLLVELDNSNARRIYEKDGFTIIKTIDLPKQYHKYSIYGFHKMIRKI